MPEPENKPMWKRMRYYIPAAIVVAAFVLVPATCHNNAPPEPARPTAAPQLAEPDTTTTTLPPPVALNPCTAVDCVRTALGNLPAGTTELHLTTGSYGDQQYIGNYNPPGTVTITADPGASAGTWVLSRTSNLAFTGITARPGPGRSGIRVIDGSHDVTFTAITVDGTPGGTRGFIAQTTTGYPRVHHVTLADSDIHDSAGDLVALYGADDSRVTGNRLHDPVISATTTDHIDGVQLTDGVNDYIGANRVYRTGAAATASYGGPHQGIIASTTTGQVIRGLTVIDNLVYDWTGTGVIVSTNGGAGFVDTVSVTGNRVDCTGGGFAFSGVTNLTQVDNTFQNYGPVSGSQCPAAPRMA